MQSARFLLAPLAILAAALPADAIAPGDTLYAATIIVTGRDNLAERERGLAEALAAVLVRVSADPDVGDRFAARENEVRGDGAPSADWVTDLDYLDRKAGIQISDEQGARDRSFELTVSFAPDAIDGLLRDLGAEPWPAPRPEIAVELRVQTPARTYRLTETGEDGYAQRLSLMDAADDLGLIVRLPQDEASAIGDGAILAGEMRITDSGLWDTEWRLSDGPASATHAMEGQSFDAAFTGALAFAASSLKSGLRRFEPFHPGLPRTDPGSRGDTAGPMPGLR